MINWPKRNFGGRLGADKDYRGEESKPATHEKKNLKLLHRVVLHVSLIYFACCIMTCALCLCVC